MIQKLANAFNMRGKYPIIIGGFYRSGTSLLRRILNAHSSIYSPTEVKFFKDLYGDYLDDPLSHLRFFHTLRTFGLNEDDLLKIYGEAFIKTYETAMKKNKKRRWADKNPDNLLYLNQWDFILDGKFYFIFITRNPYDIISSLCEVVFPKSIPSDFEDKIKLYCKYITSGLDFVNQHSNRSYIIKYEDLVAEPEPQLKKLLNFIGEKYEINIAYDYSERSVDGLEDPKITLEKKIHDKNVNRWKRDLSEDQCALITKSCGDIIKKLNYGNCEGFLYGA